MDKKGLYEFIRERKLGVLATATRSGAPEAALVGIVVTPELELVFDALETTRKIKNLRRDPRIAFVIGWQDDCTVQYEGFADEPEDNEFDRIKAIYCEAFPTAPQRDIWPGHVYVRVVPKWIRYSSYALPYRIEEFSF